MVFVISSRVLLIPLTAFSVGTEKVFSTFYLVL